MLYALNTESIDYINQDYTKFWIWESISEDELANSF